MSDAEKLLKLRQLIEDWYWRGLLTDDEIAEAGVICQK